MKQIISPLKPGDQGPDVTNLQAALLLLIDRGSIQLSAQEREFFNGLLRQEQQDQTYKDGTARSVAIFQAQRQQPSTGEVDERTADALNQVLRELGALGTAAEQQRVVGGQVRREGGLPLADVPVRAFHVGEAGSLRLGVDTTDPEGGYTIAYTMPPGLSAIQLRVVAYQDNKAVADSGLLPNAQPLQFVNLTVSGGQGEGEPQFRVTGRVFSPASAGVGGLLVHIADKGVGGDFLLTETQTDADGAYEAAFAAKLLADRGKQRPDLQARVFRGDAFLGASDVRYQAADIVTLDVRLPEERSAALSSEHEALATSLRAVFAGSLAELQETEERQDITFLANRSGWDARPIAMEALAERLSAGSAGPTGEAIEPAFFYALFRAGLPANETALYATDAQAAGEIWKQAIAQGVIPAALEARLPAAVEAFQKQVARQALDGPATFGLSPLKEMLALSLDVDPDPEVQRAKEERFADLYTRHQADPDAFWQQVREAFGEPVEQRLRLDGQLAFLTHNNAPLVSKLHASAGPEGLTGLQDLVAEGYYHAEKWQEDIGSDLVPPEIPGADEAERRARYAELLANQVRLSFPTLSVAQMVKRGETPLADGLADPVHAFLTEHQGKFELGVQPVEQYVRRNNVEITPEVSREITRLQRVYQITPSTPGDGAMNALLRRNVDSAYKVVQHAQEAFVRAFQDVVGGEANARLIHSRAQQVHNTALNIAVSYLNQISAPGIGVHSAAQIINPAPAGSAGSDVLALPTLENLLGGLDFCACEHCRSMLSPAAYLVDLLHFLDRDDSVWESFLANWRSDHGDAPYPFTSLEEWENAGSPQETEVTPLQILLSRRPDIQHLPLTCENTNTPLPYIDLVNETLEHFVASGTLAGYTGHTTDGSARVEELLANPQFVADEAYTILAGAHFPPPLPFHQPLEALRRYFDRFEAPLPRVMEALRKDDSLERAGDEAYGWRDILMEALKLSRAEYALLSERVLENGNTDVMGTVKKLYGFDPATADQDVRRTLSHAKSFSRRVEISYEELIEVLKTRFVNPGSPLIPRLERLGVSFDTLKKFKDGTITDEQFEEALAPQLDASLYGGDIKAWAKANATTILNLITLTNPNARLSRRLIELGVPLEKLKALKEGAITDDEFEAELPEGLDEPLFGGDVAQWVRDHFTPAGDDCSFEALEFRYADPDKVAEPLRDIEFIRLLRFIRLWKKLGWAISDTDKAMAALYPADQLPGESDDEAASLQKLDSGFLVLLPRLGVLRQVMQALKLKPPSDLPSVLALFAAIDTHGEPSLYRRMFLSPALLKQDPAFADDGAGNVLNDDDEKLTAHAVTLRAAFALTAEELDLITAALGVDADTPLTLEHISAIFRRGWLARALKLSVREFLLLVEFTGLDPFTGIDSFAEEDPARPPILRLIEHLHDLRATSLRPAQALYLIWNQDVSGKSAPEEEEILDFARVLRASLAAIESEFARADDPDGQIARARMALVYGSQATDLFFGLLNHTLVSEVGYDHDQAALEDPILQAAPGRIAYDDFRKRLSFTGLMTEAVRDALKAATGATDGLKTAVEELFSQNNQVLGPFFARYPELRPLYEAFVFFGALESTVPYVHPEESLSDTVLNVAPGRLIYDHEGNELSFKGVLTETIRDALKAVPGGSVQFRAAVDNLFAVNQTAIEDFFADHPALAPHQEDQEAYLRANDALEQRRSVLLASFLPELKRRRKRQQAAQAMSAVGKTEVEFARAVLDATPEFTAPAFDPRPEPVYVLHAAGDPGRPALDDLAVAEAPGLSAQFFFHATASETDPVDLHREAEAHLAYAPGSNPLPENTSSPGSPISGVWRGYLEAPEDDFYNLLIETEAGATVALTLKGNPVSLNQDGNLWSNSEPLELRAGTLYPITLTVESVQAELTVRWETHGRGREVIPARFLYPATGLDVLRQVYVRFLKAASLAAALELAADGFAYLAAHPHYRIDAQGWLNHLAVTGSPDLQTSAALLTALGALLDFARLKAALGDEDGRLLAVLQDPAAAAQEPEGPLFSLTRWDPASLDALLGHFGKTRDDLADLALFRRVYGAFAWVRQMGVPAAVLIAAATNEPEADTVRALQSALRARYKESDWLNVLKPINDEMRALQRDALVAHILQGMRSDPATAHIDTPEKLFEFFLMDVQMEPCMQTSRIRHALSSVQLFIERGLMNLEPRVSPAVIPAEQWAWMSRYRVWEANRKVFLFPENWLEPELRDDQSPFFKETMSELLQSDITEDRAAVALLNYLARLDEVAKLEPCGIYCEEDDPGTEARDEVVHVVARTAGAHRKYYYRRREYGSWTPWEQIRLDIEDNPVIPVVWRGRLLLFWLRILKQTPVDPDAMPTSSSGGGLASTSLKTITQEAKQGAQQSTKVLIQAVLCWSEYYNGKWQPVRTSDVDTPLLLGVFSPGGAGAFDRSALRLRAFEGLDGEAHKPLVIQVIGFERSGFLHILDRQVTFTLFNTHSLPVGRSETTFDQQILQDTTRAVALRLVSASGPRSRFLNTQGDTLAITYREESGIVAPGITPPRDLQRPVLQKQRDGGTDSTVEPRHELRNPWDAPFFYGDSRHLFYVTTAESVVTFLEWGGYVPGTLLEKPARELPPLVQHEPPPPTRRVPVLDTDGSSAAFGAVDPAAMRRFVTEDAYIRRGIGTSGTVRFGEVEIGPAGGLSNGIHRR